MSAIAVRVRLGRQTAIGTPTASAAPNAAVTRGFEPMTPEKIISAMPNVSDIATARLASAYRTERGRYGCTIESVERARHRGEQRSWGRFADRSVRVYRRRGCGTTS